MAFKYFDVTETGQRAFRRDGAEYVVEPVALVFNEDNYSHIRLRYGGGILNFDANGSLPAGFHDLTYDEFYDFFVTGFPSSQRRQLIAESLLAFSTEVFAFGIPCEFWIDGSYNSRKMQSLLWSADSNLKNI